jgi:hypothetical protein
MDGIILLIRKNIQLEGTVAQLQREMTTEVENSSKDKKRAEELSASLLGCRQVLSTTSNLPETVTGTRRVFKNQD